MPDEIRGSSRTSRLSLSDKGSLSRSLAYHTSRRTRAHSAFRATPGIAQLTPLTKGRLLFYRNSCGYDGKRRIRLVGPVAYFKNLPRPDRETFLLLLRSRLRDFP